MTNFIQILSKLSSKPTTSFFTFCFFTLAIASRTQAQYLEQFNTANRGYLINSVNDFTGVNWTLSPWAIREATDYFRTSGGTLNGVDFDQNLCWISPTISIPVSGVSFSVDLAWTDFNREAAGPPPSASDYIDVEYSTNGGGAWTRVPNTVGGGDSGHTISYDSGGPTNVSGSTTITVNGIASAGGTLIIRVCGEMNAAPDETITIDNVNVPLGNVGGCTAPTLSTSVTNVSCNGGNTGTIDLTVSGGGTPPYTYAWSNSATTQDIANLATGTYTVVVTDDNMCTASISATVGVAPAITRSTVVGNATCANTPDGGIDLTVSGGVPPYSYSWNSGETTQDLEGVPAGTYTVVITDAPGCTSTISATVGVTPAGAYNETFNTSGQGYLPNFEDNFSAVNWTLSPWLVTQGPPANIDGREADDYFRTSGGALTGIDLEHNICWNSPVLDINPPGSGITFTVDLSWVGFDRETPNPGATASDYIDVEYSTNGGGAWTRVGAQFGGLSGHTISYPNGGGGDISGSTMVTVPGISGNTLNIRVCSQLNNDAESISINNVSANSSSFYCPAPESMAGPDQMICDGTSATLAATANNGTGVWSVVSGPSTLSSQFSNTTASNATFTPAGGAGAYTLRWTVSAGGFPDATDDVVITVKPRPVATLTPTPNPVCQGATLNLSVANAGAGSSYAWAGSGVVNANSNTTTAVPAASGAQIYSITVTGSNACSTTGTVSVTVNPRPSATITPNPNPVCQNATLNLSVSNAGAGASYAWAGNGIVNANSNTTTAVPNTSGAQIYSVTVTGANTCTTTGTVSVTVNALPSAMIMASPNPVCQNSTISLSVPSPGTGGVVNWSSPGNIIVNPNAISTTSTPTNAGPQVYYVTVTDGNMCTNTSSVTVTVNPQPSATITPTPNPVCQGSSLNLSVPNAGAGAAYAWAGSGIVNTNTNATTAVPAASGPQTYSVTVTAPNTCTNTGTVSVTVNPRPSATITPTPNPVCQNSTLNLSVPSAGAGASYSWAGNGIVNANSNATTAVPAASGAQIYSVTVTAPNTCTNTGTVSVTVNPQPSATITPNPNPVCRNSTLNLSVPSAGGGASYNWSGNGINNVSSNATTAVPTTAGSQIYAVTVTNSSSCSNTGTVTVTVNDLPSAIITPSPNPVCRNGTLNLSVPAAGAGASYSWAGNGIVNNNSNATTAVPNTAGAQTYSVTVTNASLCTSTGTVVVTVNPLPGAQLSAYPDPVCQNSTLLLWVPNAGAGDSYNWAGNGIANVNNDSTTAVPTTSGVQIYSVTVTGANGCTNTNSLSITVNPQPSATITANPNPACLGSTITLSVPDAGAGAAYNWAGNNVVNANSASTTATPVAGTHIYMVTVTNSSNCSNTGSVTVTVEDVTPPEIMCPANIVRPTDPGQCSAVVTYTVTASDDCTFTLTRTNGFPSGSAFPTGVNIVNWKVTDSGGNTATCSFTVTVTDNQAPTITCPANIVRNTDPNQCSAVVTYANPFFSDNCPTASIIRTSGLASGSAFPKGVTMVNWKATDAAGNSSVCGFTVTVTDNQMPTITCPASISKSTDAGLCTAIVNYVTPLASDNCTPAATVMMVSGQASGTAFPKGATVVIWKATDAGGLTQTCSFTVTVNDNQAPVITCPANQTKNTDPGLCTAIVTYAPPTASDNCTPQATVVLQSGQASGAAFPKGQTIVVWKATDGAGLTKTCTFRVTVNDTQAPTISCPSNQTKTTDPGLCTAVVTYNMATFTDNCAGGTVIKLSGLNSGLAFPKGVNNVVFKATDASGNQTLCTMTVTVTDNQPPAVTCPSNIVVTGTTENGICSATVVYSNPTVSENCGILSSYLLSGLASYSVFPQGVTTNVWKVTDDSGMTATCAFTVTVNCTTTPESGAFEVRGSNFEVSNRQEITMTLAPNPATTAVLVQVTGLGDSGGDLTVFDALGRVVWQQLNVPATQSIDVATFATGLYLVSLRTSTGIVTKELIVNKY